MTMTDPDSPGRSPRAAGRGRFHGVHACAAPPCASARCALCALRALCPLRAVRGLACAPCAWAPVGAVGAADGRRKKGHRVRAGGRRGGHVNYNIKSLLAGCTSTSNTALRLYSYNATNAIMTARRPGAAGRVAGGPAQRAATAGRGRALGPQAAAGGPWARGRAASGRVGGCLWLWLHSAQVRAVPCVCCGAAPPMGRDAAKRAGPGTHGPAAGAAAGR